MIRSCSTWASTIKCGGTPHGAPLVSPTHYASRPKPIKWTKRMQSSETKVRSRLFISIKPCLYWTSNLNCFPIIVLEEFWRLGTTTIIVIVRVTIKLLLLSTWNVLCTKFARRQFLIYCLKKCQVSWIWSVQLLLHIREGK